MGRQAGMTYTAYAVSVEAAWVDFNGHMTDSAYAVACSAANEAFLEHLGMSAAYRASRGLALYTVEATLRWLRECHLGDQLRARSRVLSYDTKRLRIQTTLIAAASDESVFAGEYTYLHVGPDGVAAIPEDRRLVLAAAADAAEADATAADESP